MNHNAFSGIIQNYFNYFIVSIEQKSPKLEMQGFHPTAQCDQMLTWDFFFLSDTP